MPYLTIVMQAFDAGDEIRNAIQSVLQQQGVDFELLIAGKDETARIAKSFGDERVRALSAKHNTLTQSYNATLEQSNPVFFATMDSGVILQPGVLERMLREFEHGQDLGMVHSYFFRLDKNGRLSRDQFRVQRELLIETMGPDADYRQALVIRGIRAAGHFRIYRTDVLRTLGAFRKSRKSGTDYEMFLRIMTDQFRIRAIPEYLYSWKPDPNKHNRIASAHNWARSKLKTLLRLIPSRLRRTGNSLLQGLYRNILLKLPAWPLPFTHTNTSSTTEKRIAYYIWHFPVLSQTFVNRELSALSNSGLSVLIIADEPEDPLLADENAIRLGKHTRYLLPLNIREMAKYKRYFFFRNPFRYFNVFLFVVTHRFGPFKNLSRDRKVFSKAVYLAGILKKENISHIHSPWTDRCALLSLLASKLLGISYSVQSRAHEIHRTMYLYGLRENLENASFAITNSEYNRSYLQSLVREQSRDQIFRIYNGIDLNRFVPPCKKDTQPEIFRVLSVARLIEQKGLSYLLQACKILKDRGIQFQCEIVGGPEEQLFINYVLQLRKLHRRLELSDTVHFGGILPFEKVLEKYKSAHLFVMPSVIGTDGSRDITPNALIEAMAMKLPVISTTVTAIPEIVENGVSGLLVPPNDENALANEMMRLIESPVLRKQLGENARRKVEDSFDITKNIRNYIELFSNGVAK